MLLVSACLVGLNCKYNGSSNKNDQLIKLLQQRRVIPICPEQLGGLSTPRPPAEIDGGDGGDVLSGKALVKTDRGDDVTEAFIRGADETLKIALQAGIKDAVLKSRSPSCASDTICDGSFTGRRIKGEGVTTARLGQHGINTLTAQEFIKERESLLPSGRNLPYLGVIGSASSSQKLDEMAAEVGFYLAQAGAVLICGGRGGVMEAAARGASRAGGMVVGLLPGEDKRGGNSFLSLALATGLGEARNAVIARACDAVIAVGGGYGTLSEIGFCLKMGKPVIGLDSWELPGKDGRGSAIIKVSSPSEAIKRAMALIEDRHN